MEDRGCFLQVVLRVLLVRLRRQPSHEVAHRSARERLPASPPPRASLQPSLEHCDPTSGLKKGLRPKSKNIEDKY